MSPVRDGKWHGYGSLGTVSARGGQDEGAEEGERAGNGRSNEKLVVPEFTGEGTESELGKSARSYVRKVSALECLKGTEQLLCTQWQGLGLCRGVGCGPPCTTRWCGLLPGVDPALHGDGGHQGLQRHVGAMWK